MTPPSLSSENSAGRIPVVLVVDDSAQNRYVHGRYLRQAGFIVQEAATGSEGIRLAPESDLILLDVKLPDASGYSVCEQLKHNPATAGIPVLQTSASYIDSTDRVQGLQSGADAYLTVPLEPGELVATARSLLRARQAEAHAQRLANEWQATFRAISDGICVLDENNCIIRCNPAFATIACATEATIAGRTLQEIIPDWDSDEFRALLADPNGTTAAEFTTGGRWYRVRLDAVAAPEGEPIGRVCIAADITYLKSVEHSLRAAEAELAAHARLLETRVKERTESLVAANKELEAFTYSVSHDLRSPIQSLQNFARLLLEEHTPELAAEHHDYLVRIQRAALRMDRLTQDLLAYSRISRMESTLGPVDLATVVRQAWRETQETQKAGSATFSLQEPIPPVLGNATVLHQAAINLLSNATKFVASGVTPAIECRAECSNGRVRLWFIDNGIGIEPAYWERIFRPFERLHGASAYPGTGLGLSIVQKAIERLRGKVGVESEPGRGSRFWIELDAA